MNTIDFSQTGGYPYTQDTLDFLQQSYSSAFQGISKFISNGNSLTILTGCNITGSTASNGWVIVDGELMPFIGGTIQSTYIVRDITQNITYQNGNSLPSIHTRYAEFGVGAGAQPWTPVRANPATLYAPEAWRLLGTTGNPSINAPYINNSGSPVRFRKEPNGQVHIQGIVDRNLYSGTDVMFTLPVGYRPTRTHIFIVMATAHYTTNADRSNGTLEIGVGTNGNVWQNHSALTFPNAAHLNLSFFID